MWHNVCAFPVNDDVFCVATHPSDPFLTVGFASGHVETFRLPPPSPTSRLPVETNGIKITTDGSNTIQSLWRVRRHKGSCRTLAYSPDGSSLFSAGADGIIKCFVPESGVVMSKIAIPYSKDGTVDRPTTLHVLSPTTLLVACDSGRLHIYDLQAPEKPRHTHWPHADYPSAIMPLPPSAASTSGYSKQWASTGGTTVALTDLYKGVVLRSEDEDEELTCAAWIPWLKLARSEKGCLAVGSSGGSVALWNKDFSHTKTDRINVDSSKGKADNGVECMVLGPAKNNLDKTLFVGMMDGTVRGIHIPRRRLDPDVWLRHDEDGVAAVMFDCHDRIITAGGRVIKIWESQLEERGEPGSEGEEESSDSSVEQKQRNGKRKRTR